MTTWAFGGVSVIAPAGAWQKLDFNPIATDELRVGEDLDNFRA